MIRITDSARGQVVPFEPQNPNLITMYVCGPTVYDYAHIGNARPAVVFDTLFRLLRQVYGQGAVVYARNITDIDDKIIARSHDTGESIALLTHRTLMAYHKDMAALNVLSPTIEPKATDHIPQMIAMIQTLVNRGHAYAAQGHVLFDLSSYPDYGGLSHRPAEEEQAGARVSVASYKKHPADFVLWKPSAPDEPVWDSPFGPGRPGWHLECSAMIHHHLGKTIDIHGGGQDLLFPHHENERAQSVCCWGGPFVRHWMHNGFVTLHNQKMSKSAGNITTVHDLIHRGLRGEVIRYVLLSAHYRQPMNWDDAAVAEAQHLLNRLYRALEGSEDESPASPDADVTAALKNDLDTPRALHRLQGLASDIQSETHPATKRHKQGVLRASGACLGLLMTPSWLQGDDLALHDDIAHIIRQRDVAKKNKDFAAADALRQQLLTRGIRLKDTPEGTTWEKL
ncbi:MAG: cysteine--tRNA ligase [Alphaproteobacteria bacterium]